jgi:hypothetical protein
LALAGTPHQTPASAQRIIRRQPGSRCNLKPQNKEITMMSMQARRYYATTPSYLYLRWYGPNSPQARGRLVATAMLADGHFNPAEMREIADGSVSTTIGLEREEFLRLVLDLCEDIEKRLKPKGKALLDTPVLDQMFSDVSHPVVQRTTLNAMRAAIACDGNVSPSEAELLAKAFAAWRVTN